MPFLQISGGGTSATVILLLALFVLVVWIIKYNKTIDAVTNHSQIPFENLQFSSQQFYSLVESLVKDKAIPGVSMGRVYHSMHGVFSGKREYLRVQYQKYFFDICAAPYAKDFFVSYRQGILNVMIKSRRERTFYEQDTENMFHASIKLCLDRAIKHMEETKGNRSESKVNLFPSNLEWQ